ncbi:MAG: drug/metabolite transporter (DMT)-like permease [Acidimicrobiales bacterium]
MTERPATSDLGLLIVAVLSIASAAILTRWVDVPVLALTFWRTLGGAVLLAPAAKQSALQPTPRQWWLLFAAGLTLALHFVTWLASVDRTTIAASVSLAATAPIFVALWASFGASRFFNRSAANRPDSATWLGIALAFVGAVVITGGDLALGSGQLVGNLLAVAGAVFIACHLLIGERLRETLPTAAYTAPMYGIAAALVLLAALVSDTPLTGFDRRGWLAIVLMIIGPQMGGHTVLNALLPRLGSITVSLALLTEPIGAGLMAWLFFEEEPTAAAWIGGALIIGGLAYRLRSPADRVRIFRKLDG